MEPTGSKNVKTLLLRITTESFQTFPQFSTQWSHPTSFGIIQILSALTLRFYRRYDFQSAASSTPRILFIQTFYSGSFWQYAKALLPGTLKFKFKKRMRNIEI